MTAEVASVPCGTCRLCCKNQIILLMEEDGDVPSNYSHRTVPTPHGDAKILNHRPNGDCVYLTDSGCSIHDRAPAVCRTFDCRKFYAGKSGAERKRLVRNGSVSKELLKAGRKRLWSLE